MDRGDGEGAGIDDQAPMFAVDRHRKGPEMIRQLLVASTVLLASCGPKSLTLPDQPVDRAATCGVIAANSARLATHDIQAALPFEAMGRIIHYPLLAGSAEGSFSSEIAEHNPNDTQGNTNNGDHNSAQAEHSGNQRDNCHRLLCSGARRLRGHRGVHLIIHIFLH